MKNKILYNSQYGFRPNHSTNDAITELVTEVKRITLRKNQTLDLLVYI